MFTQLLNEIQSHERITVFRHQRPDGDAVFSTLALACFLEDNFPQKQVKVLGSDTYEIINRFDSVSDEFISDSLAIILDTSTADRIDDERALTAEYRIKIDHHPIVDEYGDLNIVRTSAEAAA